MSQLEKDDIHLVLQVHDELIFDAPDTVDPVALQAITDTMASVIPNDVGVQFKSDIEVSPYWGGNFSQEQIRLLSQGTLDWRDIFEEEVKKSYPSSVSSMKSVCSLRRMTKRKKRRAYNNGFVVTILDKYPIL